MGKRIVYACGVDWQHEICEAPDIEGKMPLYSSIQELKADRTCWRACGIVRLEISLVDWVHPQNLSIKSEDDGDDKL